MRKKTYLKIVVLIIIIVLGGLILFFQKSNLIKIMQDIKFRAQKIDENDSKDITIIDITGLTPSPESEHEHIYKTHYDDTKHWEECTICSIKRNEVTHNFTTTWALGYESCNVNNSYTKTCACGYSEMGHKPCVWDGNKYGTSEWLHWKICNACNSAIEHAYYLNSYGNGEICVGNTREWCEKSDGSRINCNNLGSCSKCKTVYSSKRHSLVAKTESGKIICWACNEEFGDFTNVITNDSNTPTTYKFTMNCNLTNGATFVRVGEMRTGTGDQIPWDANVQTVSNMNSTKTQFTLTTTAKFKLTFKKTFEAFAHCMVNVNGIECPLKTDFDPIKAKGYTVYPDIQKPTISNIQISGNEWTKSKPIIISGTENWTNTVNVKIENDRGNIIYEGGANVVNNNWSVSCTPELEAGENGRTFTVTVTDACENSTTREFTISKIDGRPPIVTSGEIIGSQTEWTKERIFTFTAEDLGVGNVQIGFNNVNDYSLAVRDGTDYSKEYKFVGDAYSPVQGSVYFKDELGNITTQVVTIDKIDNTAPTIAKGSIHNNVLTLESHDRHSTLGEGSGVIKYRYIASNEKLENPEVSGEKSSEVNVGDRIIIENISQVRYIYAVAEDLVGNVSESYEIKVPELVLTSRVVTELSEGKGGVILDWAGYETLDKYFVIYRKKENEEEFEVINNNFSGSTYTDTTANDKSKPSMPEINIQKDIENNGIKITPASEDTGTKYTYYIDAYDINTRKLIAKSNIK